MTPVRVYIGWDQRGALAFEVCRHTLLEHASIPLEIVALKDWELRARGLYWRPYQVDERGQMWDARDGKRTYQYHKLEAALAHQPPERRRVALDIGAHVGLWAMWLTRDYALVRSFEPVPAFAEIYPFNVDMTRARLHRVALGKEARSVSITVPLDQTGNAHVSVAGRHPGTRYGNREEIDLWHAVPMRTLDSFGFEEVDFIKIDVEGFERQVIEGGERTIRTWRPNIVVEQKGNEAAYGEPRDAALARLKSWGLKPLQVLSGDWIMGW